MQRFADIDDVQSHGHIWATMVVARGVNSQPRHPAPTAPLPQTAVLLKNLRKLWNNLQDTWSQLENVRCLAEKLCQRIDPILRLRKLLCEQGNF